jgi:hypothetical protein
MTKINHLSHGMGDAIIGHHKPNIAQNGAPKKLHGIAVAHGQRTRSSSTDILHGSAKRTAVAPVSPGMRSRTKPHSAQLGEAILRQAFAAAAADDCQAHGRNRDGSKC